MNTSTFLILVGIVNLIYCLSFFMFLKVRQSKSCPTYLRTFYVYPLVGVVIFIFFWSKVNNIISNEFYTRINLISLLFHYGFLSNFIIKTLSPNLKRLSIIVFALCFIVLIAFIIPDIFHYTSVSFAVGNSGLCIMCMLYYYDIFQGEHKSFLPKDPAFWIISGVFVGMAVNIPFHIFGNYFYSNFSYSTHLFFSLISMFTYAVMHLFFIKSSLCILPLRKRLSYL